MKNKINLPGFTAEASSQKGNNRHLDVRSNFSSHSLIMPQYSWDDFKHDVKCAGCMVWPFPACGLTAAFGGTEAMWNCVDQLSGGGCLDCITGLDPRDKNNTQLPQGGGGVGFKGSFLTSDQQSTDLSTQIDGLRKQLRRIERCACGPMVATYVPHRDFLMEHQFPNMITNPLY